jgi:alkaline phosphatase D
MKSNRYSFILFSILSVFGCQSNQEISSETKLFEPVASLYRSELKPFYHGVASGDPLADRVILWTRVTPEDSLSRISVRWEVSENESFDPILKSDTISTTPLRDYTVKVDVDGLKHSTHYYYRFEAFGATSMTGRTKTLSQDASDSLRFAVVSCANWEFGYFNAYSQIAEREVDAVIHLGDNIYEYKTGGYANKNSDRKTLPPHEIVTLQDYRTRYSQYHLDDGLRKVRAQHPFITIWDDHEVANDVYTEGAQNHQPEEGDFNSRKQAAKQAYYEWIPIRESGKHYRSFTFGNMVELIMLDERLEGRVKPLANPDDPALEKDYRTMLGEEQLAWLKDHLKSLATWKIIGNQVLYSDLVRPNAKNSKNLDSWHGYPLEKKAIADFIRSNSIPNVVFLTGDTHASWAFEVPGVQKGKPMAVELGTTSVSSGNANEYAPDDSVKMQESHYLESNPHLKYSNLRDHGYLLVTVTSSDVTAEWFYVGTLLQPDSHEHLGKKLTTHVGSNMLK